MSPGSSAKQPTYFALRLEEKLGRFSQRNRMISEKRNMDILFEIEMNEFEGGLPQVVQSNQLPAIQINQLPNQPALHTNQHIQFGSMQICLIQPEIVLLFTWAKCFLPIKQKSCKHSLYLNTVFSFTNNVIFQTLK